MKNVFYILLGCLYGCFLCGFVANEITAWATLSFRGDMIIGFCGVASFGILCFLFFLGSVAAGSLVVWSGYLFWFSFASYFFIFSLYTSKEEGVFLCWLSCLALLDFYFLFLLGVEKRRLPWLMDLGEKMVELLRSVMLKLNFQAQKPFPLGACHVVPSAVRRHFFSCFQSRFSTKPA